MVIWSLNEVLSADTSFHLLVLEEDIANFFFSFVWKPDKRKKT